MGAKMPREVAAFLRDLAVDETVRRPVQTSALKLLDRFAPPRHLIGDEVIVDGRRRGRVYRVTYQHGRGWIYDVSLGSFADPLAEGTVVAGAAMLAVVEALAESRLIAAAAPAAAPSSTPRPGPHLAHPPAAAR